MSDKEKIINYIIWQELKDKANKNSLNEKGFSALMYLNDVFRDTKGKDIIELINKIIPEGEK